MAVIVFIIIMDHLNTVSADAEVNRVTFLDYLLYFFTVLCSEQYNQPCIHLKCKKNHLKLLKVGLYEERGVLRGAAIIRGLRLSAGGPQTLPPRKSRDDCTVCCHQPLLQWVISGHHMKRQILV